MDGHSRLVSSLAVVAVSLVLGACGGGSNDGTTAAESTTTSTTRPPAAPDVYAGVLRGGIAPSGGVLVVAYEKGSPFATSGLLRNDVIVALDGHAVKDTDDLRREIARLSDTHVAGDGVDLTVERGGGTRTLTLTLAPNVYLGAQVQDAKPTGVLVKSASPGSPADGALRAGDVITEVDGKPVETIGDLFTAMGAHVAGDEIEVTIKRGSQQRTVRIKLAPRPGTT